MRDGCASLVKKKNSLKNCLSTFLLLYDTLVYLDTNAGSTQIANYAQGELSNERNGCALLGKKYTANVIS